VVAVSSLLHLLLLLFRILFLLAWPEILRRLLLDAILLHPFRRRKRNQRNRVPNQPLLHFPDLRLLLSARLVIYLRDLQLYLFLEEDLVQDLFQSQQSHIVVVLIQSEQGLDQQRDQQQDQQQEGADLKVKEEEEEEEERVEVELVSVVPHVVHLQIQMLSHLPSLLLATVDHCTLRTEEMLCLWGTCHVNRETKRSSLIRTSDFVFVYDKAFVSLLQMCECGGSPRILKCFIS
jgi:hypothetical protein